MAGNDRKGMAVNRKKKDRRDDPIPGSASRDDVMFTSNDPYGGMMQLQQSRCNLVYVVLVHVAYCPKVLHTRVPEAEYVMY